MRTPILETERLILRKVKLEEYKYMFFDFSFIAAIATIIILTIYTEKILTLM